MLYYLGEQRLDFQNCKLQDIYDYFEKLDEIDLDTETNHTKVEIGDIIMLQIGNEEDQFVIDTRQHSILLFKDIIEKKFINGQNLSFEKKWLKKYGINLPFYIGDKSGCYDTMLSEARITQGNFQGLGYAALGRKYCQVNLDKTEQTGFLGHKGYFTNSQIFYGGDDIKYLRPIKRQQLAKIQELGIENVVKLENLYLHVIADMEYNGMPLDKKAWMSNVKVEEGNKISIEQQLDDYIIDKFPNLKFPCSLQKIKGKETLVSFQYDLFEPDLKPVRNTKINWRASKQKTKILNKLGFEIKNKEGKATTDIKELEKINSKLSDKFLSLLIEHGKTSKILSTYGESFIKNYYREDTGRIRNSFFPVLDTGRTSSGSQDKKNRGNQFWNPTANTQNQPQQFRKFYVAPETHKFITCDYASQESRYLAEVSEDKKLVDFYLNGEADLHSYTAEKIFPHLRGKSLDEIKNNYKEERQFCKSINFAIVYGGNDLTISVNGNIPLDKAKILYTDYLNTFSGLSNYFKIQKNFTLNNGYALLNKVTYSRAWIKEYDEYKWLKSQDYNDLDKSQIKRMYILKGDIERFGLNAPIQGSSAEMSKLAGIYIYKEILENNLQDKMEIVNMCHDEYDNLAINEFAEQAAKITKDCMEKAGKVFCKTIPIVADVIISQKWEK